MAEIRVEKEDDEEEEKKRRKKRKKKKRREKRESESESSGGGESSDPLSILGPDILTKVLEYLDACSVARLLLVSRAWHGVAACDRLWAPKCEELWMGKAHIPRLSKVRGASKLAVYSMSAMDRKRVLPSSAPL